MKKILLFLPPNLLVNDLKLALTGYRDKSKVAEQACLLYHLLCIELIKQREKGTIGEYTQIHHTKLIKIFDDEYKKPLKLLIDAGLLEMKIVDEETGEYHEDGLYSKASKTSRAFRIPAKFLSTEKLFIKTTVDTTNKVLMNKIASLRNLTQSQQQMIEQYRLFVLKNMDDIILLDNEQTRSIIAKHYESRNKPYTYDLITSKIDAFNNNPVKRHLICKFGTRLHTEITNHLKEIRKSFRFSDFLNDELVEIDLVASQPWFLSIITPALIKKFVPECIDAAPIFKKYQEHTDMLKFKQLCANAEYGIYEYFRDAYNKLYNESFTRNDAKRICFRAFYTNYEKHSKLTLDKCLERVTRAKKSLIKCEEHYEKMWRYGYHYEAKEANKDLLEAKQKVKLAESLVFSHKCIQMFKNEFEGVYDLLSEIKQLKWNFERGSKTKSIKYYANPALLAQRIEANIVYTVIVKQLAESGIDKIITIHDSFSVRKKDEAKARKIIKKAFASLKLKPSLK